MHYNHTILGQVLSIIPRGKFQQIVDKYRGDYRIRNLSCWNQFVSLFYGQLRQRDTLRGIEAGLLTQQQKLYHLGIKPIKRSTLSDANNSRDYRIYEEMFYVLLGMCQQLTKNKLGFKNPIYSMDATIINVCYSLFPWARYRTRKGALKMHVLLEHDNYLPEFITITEGNEHEINVGRQMPIKPDSILVIDRGYYDFEWLYSLHKQRTTFVIRAKKDLSYTLIGQHEIKGDYSNVIADEDILVPWKTSKYPSKQRNYPEPLRMVTVLDPESGKEIRFLTNNEDYSPETIAIIYRQRWQIELFFKWIKQNLKIKSFLGTSKNAVFTQIWIAMIVYLMVWYIKCQSKYQYSLLNLTRILNEAAFERISILNILSQKHFHLPKDSLGYQLVLGFT